MRASKVDHILRAAGAVTGRDHFVLIGSAAILAWHRDAPWEMTQTREVDLFAYDVGSEEAERLAVEIDASLGQDSAFDQQYGYYCDGVGPETAILPVDWPARAKTYSSAATNGVTATVPHPNDIAVSKLCAGRPKDMSWLAAALRQRLVQADAMEELFGKLPARAEADPAVLLERLSRLKPGRLRD